MVAAKLDIHKQMNEDRFLFHTLSEKSVPNISKSIVYGLTLLNCKRKIFQDISRYN